jgi:NitT/TauT family transport system permease protein
MSERLLRVVAPLVFIAALVVLWEVLVRSFRIPSFLVPAPSKVFNMMVSAGPLLVKHIFVTIYEILLGFGLAAAFGILLSIGIVYVRFIELCIMPLIVIFQVLPKVAVAPLLVMWMGYGEAPKIVVAFLICFFSVVVNTVAGLLSTENDLIDMMHSIKANRFQIFWKVQFPNALPYIFSGFEISITAAVIGAIIGEFVGSESGLGYMIIVSQQNMNTPMMFVSITLLGLIGLILYELVVFLNKVFIPWQEKAQLKR